MMILVFIMHAMLASIYPIGRAIEGYAQPIFFTAIRMLLSGSILFVYQHIYAKDSIVIKGRQALYYLTVYTIFGMYFTNIAEFWALQFLPAAKTAFLYSLCPFFAAIMAYFFFFEKFTYKKFIGMIVGFAGTLMMLMYDAPGEEPIGNFGFLHLGELAIIFAALATTYGWVFLRKLVRIIGMTSLEANALSMMGAGILALLTSLITESWSPVPISNYIIFIEYISLAVIFSNIIGYTLYGFLLKRYTTTLLSFAGFFEPISAALYGWIFLKETVSWVFYVAGTLVFIGLYIFYNEDLKQGYIIK